MRIQKSYNTSKWINYYSIRYELYIIRAGLMQILLNFSHKNDIAILVNEVS